MNPLDNVKVVLVEPAVPGNIGSTARVLRNTGISRLALVNPGNWNTSEARWLAHGSEEILDRCEVHPDLPSALAEAQIVVGTTHRLGRFRQVNSAPRQAIAELASLAHHHRIAVVFGREKDGLWRSELQHCHQLIRFPTAVDHPSLNLSHAVLLFAYELFTALRMARPAPRRDLATAAERQRLHLHLSRVLGGIGFRPFNGDPENFSRVLHRFLNRSRIERLDAAVIHKICSQIEKFAAICAGERPL
ncbi:MAG: TrmJ/YjtD family RNA methyltransferase [Candidatus Latescibacteria bacterium]|nr:TrmJ/YjtD family RNA methyltransferase [Candidatus Latescibacterota bacterium]